jgi:hypothetical protein
MPGYYKIIKTDKAGEVTGIVPKVTFPNIEAALMQNFGVRLTGRVFKDRTTKIIRRCTTYQIDPLERNKTCIQKNNPVKARGKKAMPEKTDYSKMTHADFERLLKVEMDKEEKPSDLLSIPGVYEIASEFWNNDVLEAWNKEQE